MVRKPSKENEKEPAISPKEKELTQFIPYAKKENNGDLVVKAEDLNKILFYLKRKAEEEETISQKTKKLKDADRWLLIANLVVSSFQLIATLIQIFKK